MIINELICVLMCFGGARQYWAGTAGGRFTRRLLKGFFSTFVFSLLKLKVLKILGQRIFLRRQKSGVSR